MSYSLPPLPYEMNALEPVISEEIMKIHYGKHHAGYVANLNKALEAMKEADMKKELSREIVIQDAVKFNGGGHLNHSLFWSNLIPQNKGGGILQEGDLKKGILKDFQSFEKMVSLLSEKTIAIQGSGWGWLVYNKETQALSVCTTQIHDLPEMKGFVPLLCIDVWEHAYYLQYKNARADYVKAIFSIINWKTVEERFLAAKR
jgi:superoxide dismutase, Fe-Mn family